MSTIAILLHRPRLQASSLAGPSSFSPFAKEVTLSRHGPGQTGSLRETTTTRVLTGNRPATPELIEHCNCWQALPGVTQRDGKCAVRCCHGGSADRVVTDHRLAVNVLIKTHRLALPLPVGHLLPSLPSNN